MTVEEELACQSILYPSIPRNPTQADAINWHRVKHNNECIEEARRQTGYCDWSVEVHTMNSVQPQKPNSKLSLRPSGGPAVFRRKDSKPSITDSDNDEYSPPNLDQLVSSSQAMAMDAHVRITLEQRVLETTITDSNVDDMLASECDNF